MVFLLFWIFCNGSRFHSYVYAVFLGFISMFFCGLFVSIQRFFVVDVLILTFLCCLMLGCWDAPLSLVLISWVPVGYFVAGSV